MSQATAAETLEVRHVFHAPRERVFDAFVTRDGLERWFGPETTTARVHELDVRVGGTYEIDILGDDGTAHRVSGVYRAIDPPNRLEFTWVWAAGDYAGRETLVSVDFRADGATTELHLVHSGLADALAVQRHGDGWRSSLNGLAKALAPTS